MKTISLAAIAVAIAAFVSSASAATTDCPGGYKTFISKVSPYINRIGDADLPDLMRRGLSVYDACYSGDTFTPHGLWDQIAADMETKSSK